MTTRAAILALLLYSPVVGGLVLLCHGLYRWTRARRLRRVVFDNLNAAWDGGQFLPDGHLYPWPSAADLANDLTLYAEDCSGYLESELLPHVRAWYAWRANA